MEFYKKGASVSSVIALLLASPWANFTMTILLFGFFGSKAFLLILASVVIAIVTGFAYMYFDKKSWIEKNAASLEVDEDFSIREDAKKRWKTRDRNISVATRTKGVFVGSWSLTKMVLWWILLGILFASIAGAYIPENIFQEYMGPTFLGLIVTLAIATIIEVCSEGSSPLAFEVYRQGGGFGNAFTFLNAGVATDYTEIGLIASNIGKRAAILLPIVTVPQILVFGVLFNLFL